MYACAYVCISACAHVCAFGGAWMFVCISWLNVNKMHVYILYSFTCGFAIPFCKWLSFLVQFVFYYSKVSSYQYSQEIQCIETISLQSHFPFSLFFSKPSFSIHRSLLKKLPSFFHCVIQIWSQIHTLFHHVFFSKTRWGFIRKTKLMRRFLAQYFTPC